MGDWADEKAYQLIDKYIAGPDAHSKYHDIIATALRQAYEKGAAEGRRNAIERSAELIGRQVEPRDA